MKTIPLATDSAAKILAKAIGALLKESEGVALEMDGTWYTVHKELDNLHISLLEEERRKCITTGEIVGDMQLIYVHNEQIH